MEVWPNVEAISLLKCSRCGCGAARRVYKTEGSLREQESERVGDGGTYRGGPWLVWEPAS